MNPTGSTGEPKPLPRHRAVRPISESQLLRRAQHLIDASGLLPAAEAILHAPTGTPRLFPARALLTGLALHALRQEEMHLTKVTATLSQLSPSAQQALGLADLGDEGVSYRMVWHAYDRLVTALETGTLTVPHNHPGPFADYRTGELLCPRDCPQATITPDAFQQRLLAASIPAGVTLSSSVAIDSTDYETWARRRSWSTTPDVDPDHLPTEPRKKSSGKDGKDGKRDRHPANEPGWPRTGHDGRAQNTLDRDARDGYRSGTNLTPGGIFCGHDLHLAVNARTLGAEEVPFLIRGMRLSPAGSHKGQAGLATLDQTRQHDASRAQQPAVRDVLIDRGYSYCTPRSRAHPVRLRGIEPVFDLHPNQRGTHPGPVAGTVVIDGTVFTDALPEQLHDLPGFRIGMPREEKLALHARYDQRAVYAFTPHSARDSDGYQRLKGPALAGRLRCPNAPASLRLPHIRPTTGCRHGTPCGCGKTLTLPPDTLAWTWQRHIWGTTDWARDYGRRAAVESSNAEIKIHRAHLDRGHTRVFGTLKNAILIAFTLAAVNIHLLRDWHAKRRRPDPWATLLGETTPAPTSIPSQRTRTRRRTTNLSELAGAAPPG